MAKSRKTIPKATKDSVLKEFNHRCAICGADRPQLHHIDEDPQHNEITNIIPLCPNCHLTDQHDPTQPLNPLKLSLFRKYKDPHILKPEFHPLFTRFQFLFALVEHTDAYKIDEMAEELIDFVSEMEMGSFYAKRLSSIIRMIHSPTVTLIGDHESERFWEETHEKDKVNYILEIEKVRDQAVGLIIELLRYQKWN